MFLDRYLWNLQFGQARIVSRSRASGAPIDGVVVSAGIPEQDEALALIEQLRTDGFPYVAFKPGTVDQIRKVIAIAREADPIKVIVQVEDGHSGGHHSWEDLSDLLLATYAQLRAQSNIVLTVGGGIGTPERAADFLTGDWSVRYGRPPMPVDRRPRGHCCDDHEGSTHHQSRQGTPRRHAGRARQRRTRRLGRRGCDPRRHASGCPTCAPTCTKSPTPRQPPRASSPRSAPTAPRCAPARTKSSKFSPTRPSPTSVTSKT